MAQKRFYCSGLGEYYDDCLKVEAVIKNNTIANEAASLLKAKLMERTEKRDRMIMYMAGKRGISYEQMWQNILAGEVELTPEENEFSQEQEDLKPPKK